MGRTKPTPTTKPKREQEAKGKVSPQPSTREREGGLPAKEELEKRDPLFQHAQIFVRKKRITPCGILKTGKRQQKSGQKRQRVKSNV